MNVFSKFIYILSLNSWAIFELIYTLLIIYFVARHVIQKKILIIIIAALGSFVVIFILFSNDVIAGKIAELLFINLMILTVVQFKKTR